MKIGILTFHCAHNYGAVLQAYALKEVLMSIGHEVSVIDYRPSYLTKPYKVLRDWPRKREDSLGTFLFKSFRQLFILVMRFKKKRIFEHFVNKYLNLAEFDSLKEKNRFDVYVFGSDQIWNPDLTGGRFDKIYFGCFQEGKKLISYAASSGNVSVLSGREKELKELLARFNFVGVREASLASFLKDRTDRKDVRIVLDPTLLGGRKLFEQLKLKKTSETEPYLLYFDFHWNKVAKEIAKLLARKKGLRFIEIAVTYENLRNKDIISTASPEEFLSYIRNADCLVTTSFHGTVFGLLFEKDFYSVNVNGKLSERLVDLLVPLKLNDRLLSKITDLNYVKPIDWSEVRLLIERSRQDSLAYLIDAIGQ